MDPMMFMQLVSAGANLGSSILDKTGKKKNQPLQAGVSFQDEPGADLPPLQGQIENDPNNMMADLFKSFMGRQKNIGDAGMVQYQMPELAPLPTSGIQMPNYGPPPMPTYNRRR